MPPFPSITHYVQQTHFFLSSPHLGTQEFECVREAFATNWIAPLGPHVDAFEREFGERLNHPTEGGRRRAEYGRRRVRPVPNPRAGKPVPRGMGFPAHIGAIADRRPRIAAHGTHGRIFDRRERRDRRAADDGGRRIGREEAQRAQESDR